MMHVRVALIVSMVLAVVAAHAQPPEEPIEPEDPAANTPPMVSLEQLPAQLRLGARVQANRQRTAALPAVVIVRDTASYIAAIEHWSPGVRFPVLIDDGTSRAAEDIARFVRGYQPSHIVLWESGEAPMTPGRVRRAVTTAIASAWDASPATEGGGFARWDELDHTPPGVIVTSAADSEWTAALALAAGHGQPIIWATAARGVNRAMSIEDADALEAAVQHALRGWSWSWDDLGDDIDALTLCLPLPARVRFDDRSFMATTDYLARREPRGANPRRWAWAGQIFGGEATAAYMAMSSLFLSMDRAWIFDGYPPEGAFLAYDGTRTGEVLREDGLEAIVHDAPNHGERDWRNATCRPVDAGLFLVNTRGMRDWFGLTPGRCASGDVPFLTRPGAVYFVHSWSAMQAAERATIAGRWLERGAYAYVGAVQEPYLQAFVPTPLFAQRFAAGAPWGVAARQDPTPVWKVAVFGDPLVMLDGPRRGDGALPLDGARDLDDLVKDALRDGDRAMAVRLLTMLGRDTAAAREAESAMREGGAFTEALAEAALLPLFRADARDAVVRAFASMSSARRDDGEARDVLWHAAWPQLGHTQDAGFVAVLLLHLREDQLARDAIDLAPAVERVQGAASAQTMLADVRRRLATERERTEFDRAVRGGR